MTGTTAIMICGQGSNDDTTVAAFASVVGDLARQFPAYRVGYGFFDPEAPTVESALESLISGGAGKIICIAAMLTTAGPAATDLASAVRHVTERHPDITFVFGRDLAIDSKLLAAASVAIAACEQAAEQQIAREDSLLMVVGQGSAAGQGNSHVAKVARMLWEGMGFGWAEVSFAERAFPGVDVGMDHALKLGFRRILVFPYFLFSDPLIARIYDRADAAAAANPAVDILKASHLNDPAQWIGCLSDRIQEAINGSNTMNCMQCSYRDQVTADADDGPPPQHDHGHGHDHPHSHDHSHSHSHGHSHSHSHAPGRKA
ncbi:MAG: sirohydrochlorin chelatase [Rhodospirillales bacterium]|nr:sirohydrochlorin chelatase [Rhodospirillales bacterium]